MCFNLSNCRDLVASKGPGERKRSSNKEAKEYIVQNDEGELRIGRLKVEMIRYGIGGNLGKDN